MKTIKQECLAFFKIICNQNFEDGSKFYFTGNDISRAVEHGVKFAQMWVKYNEELPSIGDDVIVRFFYDGWNYELFQNISKKDIRMIKTNKFEWRPIEYK